MLSLKNKLCQTIRTELHFPVPYLWVMILNKYRIKIIFFNTETLEDYLFQGQAWGTAVWYISNNSKGSSAADLLDFTKCCHWLFSTALSLDICLHNLPILLFNVTKHIGFIPFYAKSCLLAYSQYSTTLYITYRLAC